jgi:hypothetical protein
MTRILFLVAIVGLWLALRPLLRLGLASLFAGDVARRALERQPDSIRLAAAGPAAWQDRARAERSCADFRAHGFADAGTWTVPEMPGVVVALLVSPAESVTAAVYEHPKVGGWCELFFRAQDGTSATFTTSRPTGLNERPGHAVSHLTGGDPAGLIAFALSHRPQTALTPVSAETAPRCFEEAVTEALAYRKAAGISRGEVVNVARQRAA